MDPATSALQRLVDARERGQLAQACERLGVALLVAHGSTVEDAPLRPPRDLDLAVELDDRADLLAVVAALTDLAGIDDVDVMDLGRADVVARSQALGPGIALHEREPGRFARRQMAALTMAWDSAWLRRRDLDLLATR